MCGFSLFRIRFIIITNSLRMKTSLIYLLLSSLDSQNRKTRRQRVDLGSAGQEQVEI